MEVKKLGHARLTYDNEPIVTYTKWTEDLKNENKFEHCVGMTGMTTTPTEGTITVDHAVPVDGEQFDYRAALRNGTILEMQVWEANGWRFAYKGFISAYKRDEGVKDSPVSNLTISVVPN